jgi:cleavage and polyadenylation specificity factor subunit 2
MLEWLSQEINLQDRPLEFKHIKIVSTYAELSAGPRLVIVDGVDIQPGTFAYQAFLDFKSSGHLLLFPWNLVDEHSIAGILLKKWDETSPALSDSTPRSIVTLNTNMNITHVERIPLQGDDLIQWKRQDKLTRDRKTADAFYEQQSLALLEDQPSDSEDEDLPSIDLLDEKSHRLRGSAIVMAEGNYDYWRSEPIRAGFRSFPFIERRKQGDEYGFTIRPEDFSRLEDESKPVVEQQAIVVGKKRKWVEETKEEDGEGPCREIKKEMQITVNCRVGYVDLEGLHDGRAVGNLLPRCNARKLVRRPKRTLNDRLLWDHLMLT